MNGKMTLSDLIKRLKAMPQDMIVKDGFGEPHSDRGCYDELAFTPEPKARIGDMLAHACSALGKTFTGYKGGKYTMYKNTSVYIGHWGECGEEITSIHFKYWELTGKEMDWQPIETVPRDETHVLLFIKGYGMASGWFAKGQWTQTLDEEEYDGPEWVCLDDTVTFEVEHIGPDEYYDHPVTHWRPLPEPPEESK